MPGRDTAETPGGHVPAYLAGGTFPREFTCDGANRPPRLQWSTPPSGTSAPIN